MKRAGFSVALLALGPGAAFAAFTPASATSYLARASTICGLFSTATASRSAAVQTSPAGFGGSRRAASAAGNCSGCGGAGA